MTLYRMKQRHEKAVDVAEAALRRHEAEQNVKTLFGPAPGTMSFEDFVKMRFAALDDAKEDLDRALAEYREVRKYG